MTRHVRPPSSSSPKVAGGLSSRGSSPGWRSWAGRGKPRILVAVVSPALTAPPKARRNTSPQPPLGPSATSNCTKPPSRSSCGNEASARPATAGPVAAGSGGALGGATAQPDRGGGQERAGGDVVELRRDRGACAVGPVAARDRHPGLGKAREHRRRRRVDLHHRAAILVELRRRRDPLEQGQRPRRRHHAPPAPGALPAEARAPAPVAAAAGGGEVGRERHAHSAVRPRRRRRRRSCEP
jgi:hypothetical protein